MRQICVTRINETIETFLQNGHAGIATLTGFTVSLRWLGQAGFLIQFCDLSSKNSDTERTVSRDASTANMVIDPYLSDSLAIKYRGKIFPHQRMMPPPVSPENIHGMDAVLCTHAHTDHLDPGTIPELAKANPECKFFVPRSTVKLAQERGVPTSRMETFRDGETLILKPGIQLTAIASAHETRQYDEDGNDRFLGYVIQFGGEKSADGTCSSGMTLYHGGDGVPYPGLAERLKELAVDIAIVPVNGRDSFRREHGVPGNATFDEAVTLCLEAGISTMIPAHFGMFDFNTLAESVLEAKIQECTHPNFSCIRPQVEDTLVFCKTNACGSSERPTGADSPTAR